MKPMYRAILAGLVGFISALAAVVTTLPPDLTLSQVPLSAWLLASVSGLTSVYAPNGVSLSKPPDTL